MLCWINVPKCYSKMSKIFVICLPCSFDIIHQHNCIFCQQFANSICHDVFLYRLNFTKFLTLFGKGGYFYHLVVFGLDFFQLNFQFQFFWWLTPYSSVIDFWKSSLKLFFKNQVGHRYLIFSLFPTRFCRLHRQ